MPSDSKHIWNRIASFFTLPPTSESAKSPGEDSTARIHSANDATSETEDDAGRANSTFTFPQPFITRPISSEQSYAPGQNQAPQVKTHSPEMSNAKKYSNSWNPRNTIDQSPVPATSGKSLHATTTSKRKSIELSPPALYGRQPRANASQQYGTNPKPEHSLKKRRTSSDDYKKVLLSPAGFNGRITPNNSPHHPMDSSHKRLRTIEREGVNNFDMGNYEYHNVERMVRSSKAPSEERHRSQLSSENLSTQSHHRVGPSQSPASSKASKLLHAVVDADTTPGERGSRLSQDRQKRRRPRPPESPAEDPDLEIIEDSDAEKQSFPIHELPGRKDFSKSIKPGYPSMTLPFAPSAEREEGKEVYSQRLQTSRPPSAETGSPESTDELQLGERLAAKEMHVENGVETLQRAHGRLTHPSRGQRLSNEGSESDDKSPKPRAFPRTNFVREQEHTTQTKLRRPLPSSKKQLPDLEIPIHEISTGQKTSKGLNNPRLILDQSERRFKLVYMEMRRNVPANQHHIPFDNILKATFGQHGTYARLEYTKQESDGGARPDQFIEFQTYEGQVLFKEILNELVACLKIQEDTDDHLKRMKTNKMQEMKTYAGKRLTTGTMGDPEELKFLEDRVRKGKHLNDPNSAGAESKKLKRKDLLQTNPESPYFSGTSTRRNSRRANVPDKESSELAQGSLLPQRSSRRIKENPPKPANSSSSIDGESRTVVKYSETHGLGEPWKDSLVFPPEGPNKVTVDFEDLKRLDEDEFLNDNLIQFFLRYFEGLRDKESSPAKVHIFNTYFYSTLTNTERGSKSRINYERVKRWTSKIDLFSYDYAIVPINEAHHWYAAIICNLQNLLTEFSSDLPAQDILSNCLPDEATDPGHPPTSDNNVLPDSPSNENKLSQSYSKLSIDAIQDVTQLQPRNDRAEQGSKGKAQPARSATAKDPSRPVIIMLDSFGIPRNEASRNLKDYLQEEGRVKKQVEFAVPSGINAKGLPIQTNFADCGIYLIGYIARFLRNPREFVTKVVQRSYDANEDWSELDPHKLRNDFRDNLQDKYHRQARAKQKPVVRPESSGREKACNSTAMQQGTEAVADDDIGTSPQPPKIRIERSPLPVNAPVTLQADKQDDEDMLDQGDESVVVLNSQDKPTGSDTFFEQLQSAAFEADSHQLPEERRPASRHGRRHGPRNIFKDVGRHDDPIL